MQAQTSIGSIDFDLSGESSEGGVNAMWRGLLEPTPGSSVKYEGLAINTGQGWLTRSARGIPQQSTTDEELSITSTAVLEALETTVPFLDENVVESIVVGDRYRIESLHAQLDRNERQAERIQKQISILRAGLPE